MKVGTLMCIAVVFIGVSMLQYVNGGKKVTDKKLENWIEKKDKDNYEKKTSPYELDDLKSEPEIPKHGKELLDMLEVIQYIITDVFNNKEFRKFMIKRFLHNYVPHATDFLKRINKLKMEMDPKSAKIDEQRDEKMKNSL
ncbi:Hypothetical protein CINCED_3A010141 [Cinara cedri]|uniref:Uncharacterized protein n=1 Tax=Cinara cedri TaxID=506608 RepID=A0A5E4MI73_9HEMI|nr:Hypothetical protein CINCED_3A010141 [Cinara cedri]